MGKRGPAPKGEYGGKTAVFSTRLQPDTRARLVAAAKKSRRSLSQELENRLRRTFIDDEKAAEFFGSEQDASIVKFIGAVIHSIQSRPASAGDPKGDWLKHPSVFDRVVKGIVYALVMFRPGGPGPWGPVWQADAAALLEEIRVADPSVPLTRRSSRQHKVATLKDGLGGLLDRAAETELVRNTEDGDAQGEKQEEKSNRRKK